MTSHSTIFKAGLLCLGFTPTVVFAQSDVVPEKKQSSAPRLMVGAQTGASLSLATSHRYVPYMGAMGNFGSGSIGLFTRKYFGKHLAVQADVNVAVSTSRSFGTPGYFTRTVSNTSYSIPIQLQYHLLSEDSRIRPYFGIGAGVTLRTYRFSEKFSPVNGTDQSNLYWHRADAGFVQITQGVSWQLNDKWQLNQSLTLQHEFKDRRNNIGMQIGLGYKLR